MKLLHDALETIAPHLPRGADRLAGSVQRSALALAWRRPHLRRITGRSAAGGRQASVVVAGESNVIGHVLRRLFDGPVEETPLGRCWLGALPRRLGAATRDADLVIARVENGVVDRLFGEAGLRMPELVDARIAVPPPGTTWPTSDSARSNQRRIEANGLSWTVSSDPADFDRFHDEMYIPHATGRFAEDAMTASRAMLRHRFGRGSLQWIWQGPRLLAAQLLVPNGSEIDCAVMGTAEAGDAALKLGAGSALKLFAVQYARRHGFATVNLGGSLPSLDDPVLLSKRYWGAELILRRRATHDIVIDWAGWNDLTADFLTAFAPLHREGGRLFGLALDGAGAATPARLGRRLGMPGLTALGVIDDALAAAAPHIGNPPGRVPVVGLARGTPRSLRAALRAFAGTTAGRPDHGSRLKPV